MKLQTRLLERAGGKKIVFASLKGVRRGSQSTITVLTLINIKKLPMSCLWLWKFRCDVAGTVIIKNNEKHEESDTFLHSTCNWCREQLLLVLTFGFDKNDSHT